MAKGRGKGRGKSPKLARSPAAKSAPTPTLGPVAAPMVAAPVVEKPAAAIPGVAASATEPPKTTNALWRATKFGFAAILAVATLIGFVTLYPHITIEPSGPPDASNPLSGYFKITNSQFYPYEDLKVSASIWCEAIGRSATKIDSIDKCEHSMGLSEKKWQNHQLGPDESIEVSLGNVAAIWPPSALLYAEISITVSFKPWILPRWPETEFRFATRRLENGEITWLRKPMK